MSASSNSPFAGSAGLPKTPKGDPVFAAPWQATAFAMTVRLHEQGVFSWIEWADALSAKLHQPDGGDYYDCWVAALSQLVTEHSITSDPELTALTRSWQRAADATPHGRPICLENDPLRSEGINSGDVIDASPTKETNR